MKQFVLMVTAAGALALVVSAPASEGTKKHKVVIKLVPGNTIGNGTVTGTLGRGTFRMKLPPGLAPVDLRVKLRHGSITFRVPAQPKACICPQLTIFNATGGTGRYRGVSGRLRGTTSEYRPGGTLKY